MSTGNSAEHAGRSTRPATIAVWDPLVRVFHWSMVGIMAYEFLGNAGDATHRLLGYIALGLITVRVLWGFIGTRHARFTDFVKSPSTVFAYIHSIAVGTPDRSLGHNPAGGAMVIALLITVALVGGTGYAMRTEALWGQVWIENLHELLANLMLVLIAAHVIGVIVASVQHRENLVKSMITGSKQA